MATPRRAYQFKITLKRTSPPVWRRIQVPETCTFWDLHVAIQDAMGWLDYHLHEFTLLSPKTSREVRIWMPDPNGDFGAEDGSLTGWEEAIADYFSGANPKATYTYDFGDAWVHDVKFEKVIPAGSEEYPICIDGRRACPPEDCGGPSGYMELLEILEDRSHEQHQELVEWIGGEFDPEHFDPEEVCFEDAAERKQWLLELENDGD